MSHFLLHSFHPKPCRFRLQLIEQFSEFAKRMKSNLTNLRFEERKQIVRLLVEEVKVNTKSEEVTVRHILPLDKKFPLCKGSNITTTGKHRRAPVRAQRYCNYDVI